MRTEANGNNAIASMAFLPTASARSMCKHAHMDEYQSAAKALVDKMLAKTGLTLSELARGAGLTETTLTRFYNKPVKHSLSAKTLAKLSAFSGVAVPAAVSVPARRAVTLAGYVGAGDQIFPFDDGPGGLETVDPPPGADKDTVAVLVRGASMMPAFWDGDVLYYSRDAGVDRDEVLYKECIAKVINGPTYIKVIMPGSSVHLFTLTSYNAPPIIDVELEWAAPVQFQDKRRRRSKA